MNQTFGKFNTFGKNNNNHIGHENQHLTKQITAPVNRATTMGGGVKSPGGKFVGWQNHGYFTSTICRPYITFKTIYKLIISWQYATVVIIGGNQP